jgi:hypothetical protein
MPESFPLAPETMPVPQKINRFLVIAAMRRDPRDGEMPDQYEVICYEGSGEPDPASHEFVVWRAAFQRYDGYHGHWIAVYGHYQLTWDRAREVFARRTGLIPAGSDA